MEEKRKEQSLEKTNPCLLAELLKNKEAVKELADIFADSVVNKFAERFGSPRQSGVSVSTSLEVSDEEFAKMVLTKKR